MKQKMDVKNRRSRDRNREFRYPIGNPRMHTFRDNREYTDSPEVVPIGPLPSQRRKLYQRNKIGDK